MRRVKLLSVVTLTVLLSAIGMANVITTNVLRVDNLSQMLQGAVVQNKNGGLYSATSDYKISPNEVNMMMGYKGSARGLVYTNLLDLTGSSNIQAGMYTMTLQVGTNDVSFPWHGLWDTVTTNYDRAAGGFTGALFTQLDASGRVAYTMDSANDFNLMSGVTVTVTSDSAVDVLNPSNPPALAEDTWYDAVFEWEITQDAADALAGKDVYVGFAMAAGDTNTSLWMANAQLVSDVIPEPATIGLFGVAAMALIFARRLRR